MKKEYISKMPAEKVDAYLDDWKSRKDLSLLEQLNIKCDNEAKNLITNTMQVGHNSGLSFHLSSLLVLHRRTEILANVLDLRTTMYRSLA